VINTKTNAKEIYKKNIIMRYISYILAAATLNIIWVITQVGGDFGDGISDFWLLTVGVFLTLPFCYLEYVVIRDRKKEGLGIFGSIKKDD
jgi:hypothetical protein